MQALTREGIATLLFGAGAVEFGPKRFKLHDDYPKAPLSLIYTNLRSKPKGHLTPETLRAIGYHLAKIYMEGRAENFNYVVGLPNAGEPLATAFVEYYREYRTDRKVELIYLDKVEEENGRRIVAKPGQKLRRGNKVLMIDDALSLGGTKIEAIPALRSMGLRVNQCIVLIDNEFGGEWPLMQIGVEVIKSSGISNWLNCFEAWGLISRERHFETIDRIRQIAKYLHLQMK